MPGNADSLWAVVKVPSIRDVSVSVSVSRFETDWATAFMAHDSNGRKLAR